MLKRMRWQDWIQILGLVGNRARGISLDFHIQVLKGEWYVVSPKDEKSQALVLLKENYKF